MWTSSPGAAVGACSPAAAMYISLLSTMFVYAAANQQEIERHLEMGKQFLAKAQFGDALTHYHAAIELDPTNYQTLYRRATVYLAMGKSKQALPDLDKVIQLKPDFTSARTQRGSVLLKQGDLDGADKDFRAALDAEPGNADAAAKKEHVKDCRAYVAEAKAHFDGLDYASAEWYLNKALDHMVWDASLYRMRSKCLQQKGEARKAIADLRTTTKLVADSTEVFYDIAVMYYEIGDVEESLTQIRECLKLNPDHKTCFPYYKNVKKLAKMRDSLSDLAARSEWTKCLEKGQQILKFEKEVPAIQLEVFRKTCRCQRESGHLSEAIAECGEVLAAEPGDVDVLCDRAEAYLLEDMFDEAIEDFRAALKQNEELRKAREGLERAERAKKQAGKRDYYKILGVKRNANKREITKAYRKLAQKWHPDNFQDDAEKKAAEKKFIDIAAAKEVLQDEEKRRQFDQGIDPLDTDNQGHGGHHGGHHQWHHYQQAHQHFGGGGGGGPFSFKWG